MSSKILLVDDSKIIRNQVRRSLEQTSENYEISEASDGLEALTLLSECIRKDLPDVIVLDRNMPNMSGDECIRILKQDEHWKSVPVLFLTAQADMSQLVLGLAELAEDESRQLNMDLEQSLIEQQRAYEELKQTKLRLAETEAAAKLTGIFEKFVPKEFIRRIAPEGLENLKFGQAESDVISMLFCDIRSFTDLSEKLTPQELVDFFNGYLKQMNDPISQNQGFVDKFIGDAIMVLFSLPGEPNSIEAIKLIFLMKYIKKVGKNHLELELVFIVVR